MIEIDITKEKIDSLIKESNKNILFIIKSNDIRLDDNISKDLAQKFNIKYLDLGLELSKKLINGYNYKYLNTEVELMINQIISNYKKSDLLSNKELLILSNIGMLWEKDLHLSVDILLKRIVKNTNLILVWSGFIDIINNKIFLLDNNSSYFSLLKDLEIYICREWEIK
jgi:hypothetical protein